MKDHLAKLYRYLLTVDKSAAISVARHFRKISADPFDAPKLWEIYPEDLEGSWDTSKYFKEETETPMGQSTTGIELLPDSGGEVSPEEIEGIKALLRFFQDRDGYMAYDFQSAWRISPPDNDGRKVWRVLTDFRTIDPQDVPERGTLEWEVWEVYPGEYGYTSSVKIPGTNRRIYGEA